MSGEILHFAYGSNMDSNRLHKRIGNVSSPQRACLSGFRFEFNKLSYHLKTVYGNIMVAEEGIEIWGYGVPSVSARLSILDLTLDLIPGLTLDLILDLLKMDISARIRSSSRGTLRREGLLCTRQDQRRPSYCRLILAGTRQEARTWAET